MAKYSLPDLSENPKIRLSYIINNKQYSFSFVWLGTFCLLSIFILQNNKRVFLIQEKPISLNSDLLARVKDNNLISGRLFIRNKFGEDVEMTQDNFSSDFEMEYCDE